MTPIIPHFAYECLDQLDIKQIKWPDYDESILIKDKINIVIQINGKKRTLLDTESDQDEEKIFKKCLEIESVKKLLADKHIIKKIYVKNKLVNIVVK